MPFSFDTGGDNSPIRSIIYNGEFEKKLERFAESFKKSWLNIENKYAKKKSKLDKEMEAELNALTAKFKKRLKVEITIPVESE